MHLWWRVEGGAEDLKAEGVCMSNDIEALADEVHRDHIAGQTRGVATFWAKVKIGGEDECWPWTGYCKESGHGLTSYKSEPIHASRKAYILTHGPISSKICVLHRCDNPPCCNPKHLYPGTRADNMIDFWSKTPADERCARGRPTTLTGEQLEQLWQRRRSGAKLAECAKEFGVHVATICRYITALRKQKLEKLRADRLVVRKNTGIEI
jgi:HNH endonuclease